MGKYLCGICAKNVRYSGILCTGVCNKWVHFKCANLSPHDVKLLENEDSIGEWECVNCRHNEETVEGETIMSTVEFNKAQDLFDCSSLADEINQSILNENEVLKQEIHDTKNRNAMYILELEDKIKQNDECLVAQKKAFEDKENDLLIQIKSLESKLKSEKEIKNSLILEVDSDNEVRPMSAQNVKLVHKCNACVIYKEETKKMLDSIRTLESIIKMLEEQKLDLLKEQEIKDSNNKILTVNLCNDKSKVQDDRWESVFSRKKASHQGPKGMEKGETNTTQTFKSSDFPPLQNRYSVLSLLSEENSTCEPRLNSSHGKRQKSTNTKPDQDKPRDPNLSYPVKIRCFSDSQGRFVTNELRKRSAHNVSGVLKPGAKFDSVMEGSRDICSDLEMEDVAVIIAGTNDVASNDTKNLVRSLKQRLQDLRNTNILLFNIPHRYDLPKWSCVNKEVKTANEQLHKVCNHFDNVRLVDLSNIGARFHTRHGLHLNKLGRLYIVNGVLDFVNSVKLARKVCRPSIPMGFNNSNFLV